MHEKKKQTTDEIIAYLLESQKEMREETQRYAQTPEFQKVLAELRARKNNS